MKTNTGKHKKTLRALLFSVVALAAMTGPVFAFQSLDVQSITAGAFIGGSVVVPPTPSTAPIFLDHTPLVKGSPITKQLIILGEAGFAIHPTPPAYETRLKPTSDFGPTDSRAIRIRVQYRFMTLEEIQAGVNKTVEELPTVEGPDPTAFAFEIPKSSAADGTVLQYRIIAERIKYSGNSSSVGTSTTSPTSEPFWSVGVQANALQVFGPDGGRFTLADGNPVDGETAIDIPKGLLSQQTAITLDEVSLNGETPGGFALSAAVPGGLNNPINVYRVDSEPPINGGLQISLLYPDFEFPQGQDGVVDGTSVKEDQLGVVQWDGFAWRRLGITPNFQSNTLTVKIRSLGYFAIVGAGAFSPEARRPMQKIITPNGDSFNPKATFSFDPGTDVTVDIFDINGHRVRTVHSNQDDGWDGRDDEGKVVESGVYIYQYQVDGKRVSGMIGVAK